MSAESARDKLRRLTRGAKPSAPACGREVGAADASPTVPSAQSDEGSAERESEIAGDDPTRRVGRDPTRGDHACEPLARGAVSTRLARRAELHARSSLAAASAIGADPDVRADEAGAPQRVRELSLDVPRDLSRGAGGSLARTATWPTSHAHGTLALDAYFAIDRACFAETARDARLMDVDFSRAVFLDTETTGLSGGSGTYVFLIGLGRFVADRFELWQGFLPHPAEEKHLLDEVAARIASASLIISFFGKSFDRHRLEDKMRVHGVAAPFAQRIHLDLYYPLRRAHRGKYENCRLKTLERELVGVARDDDLPGSFAPAAWFDFLARRPHRLEGVFRHNQDDVLSLVTLAAHAGSPDERASDARPP